MPRYIDAYLAEENINQWIDQTGAITPHTSYHGELIGCIEDTPTEDVVPVVHAHWVSEESKSVGWSVGWDNEIFGCPESTCYCSHCGKWLTASDEYHVTGKYCPNCGANMGFVNGQTGGKKDG